MLECSPRAPSLGRRSAHRIEEGFYKVQVGQLGLLERSASVAERSLLKVLKRLHRSFQEKQQCVSTTARVSFEIKYHCHNRSIGWVGA